MTRKEQWYCNNCGTKIPDEILKDPYNRECPNCKMAGKFIDYDPKMGKQKHIELCTKWAKRYYDLGLNVIPIKYKSKIPKGFKKGEIEQWHYKQIPKKIFERWCKEKRFENIAILGGQISQDLVCLDFDNPDEFKALTRETKDKKIVVTPENLIETGAWVTETPKEPGRYHVVVRDKNKAKATRLEKHIDYRANEHYWLVCPSIHPNGTLKWSYNLGTKRVIGKSSPTISADGTIYVGTHIGEGAGGEIIAVNYNGTEKWRKKIADEWVDSSPSIGKDGTVYIGSASLVSGISFGYIHAFGPIETNEPPTKPNISGETNGNAGSKYEYTFVSNDPEGFPVKFYIE